MRAILTISLMFVIKFLSAQEGSDPFYVDFRGFQIDEHVQIDFGIVEGASCFGVELQRRNKAGQFIVVNNIQGVCGGSEFTEYYSIRDENPEPYSENVYRLKFGLDEFYSERLNISYIPNDEGVVVYPNPAEEDVKIRFENVVAKSSLLRVFNSEGKVVLELECENTQEYEFSVSEWKSGIYPFELQLDSKSYFDKIIVR